MLNSAARAFRTATWLGWQIESNWTDPFLFFIYSILRPITSVMILVVMYLIVSRSETSNPLFAYIYLGNAFYIYVTGVMVGVCWAVIDDREHYSTLKYIYLAPIPYIIYLFGRGVARLITSTMAVVITIAFGVLVLGLGLNWAQLNVPLLFATLVVGIISLALIGLFLGGASLLFTQEAWHLGDAVAGALYLFSGAIFPLSVLPDWLRPIGYGMPITYWLELLRRALLGSGAAAFPTLAGYSDAQLFAVLAGMTALYGVIAVAFFGWAENRARKLGLLDVESHS
jgi:ABC-2 type transport system permease protein